MYIGLHGEQQATESVLLSNAVCSGEAGWNYAALRCYRLFTYDFVYSDRTWTTAQNQCRTHGGKLVSINSANEAYVLSNFLKVSWYIYVILPGQRLLVAFFKDLY